jgi:F420-dependent oxidoreductase-like protein
LYGFDAISALGFLAAKTSTMQLMSGILPIYSRTPTLTAMTAAGLDALSEGRFNLGLGVSGPQVIEGWHGVKFDAPIGRTREIMDICRQVWRREKVTIDGKYYTLPLPEDQGTGLGKPLKMINHMVRPDIPIYLASLGPKNVELTAEAATGWLPIFFHPDKAMDIWGESIEKGMAKRDASLGPLEMIAGGTLSICDEDTAQRLRDQQRGLTALYVGGMGAKGKNFYNDIFCRYGYEEQATKIQELYLSGHREEAEALVPDEFLAATQLVGDEGFVRDRIESYRAAGVTWLQVHPVGENRVEMLDKVKGWAA